jgi:hypothetical protein
MIVLAGLTAELSLRSCPGRASERPTTAAQLANSTDSRYHACMSTWISEGNIVYIGYDSCCIVLPWGLLVRDTLNFLYFYLLGFMRCEIPIGIDISHMAWSPFPWRCRIVIRCIISDGILNYCTAGGLFFFFFFFFFPPLFSHWSNLFHSISWYITCIFPVSNVECDTICMQPHELARG